MRKWPKISLFRPSTRFWNASALSTIVWHTAQPQRGKEREKERERQRKRVRENNSKTTAGTNNNSVKILDEFLILTSFSFSTTEFHRRILISCSLACAASIFHALFESFRIQIFLTRRMPTKMILFLPFGWCCICYLFSLLSRLRASNVIWLMNITLYGCYISYIQFRLHFFSAFVGEKKKIIKCERVRGSSNKSVYTKVQTNW